MIDKTVLYRWEESLRSAETATFPVGDALELIRLARLGLQVGERNEQPQGTIHGALENPHYFCPVCKRLSRGTECKYCLQSFTLKERKSLLKFFEALYPFTRDEVADAGWEVIKTLEENIPGDEKCSQK